MSELRLENINYSIHKKRILDDVNIEIFSGDVLGVIGSNGAGKTSLLELISGVIRKFGGNIFYDGKNISQIKNFNRKIGYISQDIALYEKLTGYENLKFWSNIYNVGTENIEKIILDMGLEEYINKKVYTYSGGMKRKLNMATSIMHFPEIIIMDEPLVGIDNNWISEILQIIKSLSEEGKIIIVTSHKFDDFSKVWNKLCILSDGRVTKFGELKKMIDELPWTKKIVLDASVRNLDFLSSMNGVVEVNRTSDFTSIYYDENKGSKEELGILMMDDINNSYKIKSVRNPDVENIYQAYK